MHTTNYILIQREVTFEVSGFIVFLYSFADPPTLLPFFQPAPDSLPGLP